MTYTMVETLKKLVPTVQKYKGKAKNQKDILD